MIETLDFLTRDFYKKLYQNKKINTFDSLKRVDWTYDMVIYQFDAMDKQKVSYDPLMKKQVLRDYLEAKI